jgi:integrase
VAAATSRFLGCTRPELLGLTRPRRLSLRRPHTPPQAFQPSRRVSHRFQATCDHEIWAKPGSDSHRLRFSRWFEQHARRAGLPKIRLHDLRHSYASAALAAGVPAKVVSERLGHATVAVTMDIYSHVLPGLDREAADTVARLILGGGSTGSGASVNKPLASGRGRGDDQDG